MLRTIALALLVVVAAAPAADAQQTKKPPYWASIAAGKAMMRTGPGKEYPATWLYQRADLPVRVVEVYPEWRKVQDPAGTTGWMLVRLLSDTRTALVTGTEPRPMRDKPDPHARVRFFAQPGVVGRLSKCANNWCQLDVKGRKGFIQTDHFWGTDPGESF